VRFWDTSALVPLLLREPETARAERWLREDAAVMVWTLTRVELLSALARRRRQEPAAAKRLQAAHEQFLHAWDRWSEVTAADVVRRQAERLVEQHPLRASDALQLGAAIVGADGDPAGLAFVTFDRQQARAAEREGFRVLGP
jgi:predicted nucleic acid-binding protein